MFKRHLIITGKADKRQLHSRVRRETKDRKDKPLHTQEEKLTGDRKTYVKRNKCMSEMGKKVDEVVPDK